MSWGSPLFVIAIIAFSYGAWLINSSIRARHGYPLENEWGGTARRGDLDADRRVTLLSSENEKLTGKVSRLEERIAVLERIATDANSKASRLADEIEELR